MTRIRDADMIPSFPRKQESRAASSWLAGSGPLPGRPALGGPSRGSAGVTVTGRGSEMHAGARLLVVGLVAVSAAAAPALTQETPKQGGMFTYMIPADAPPSLDGHRETTYATVHTAAPFYSTLIRIHPQNPSSTTDF